MQQDHGEESLKWGVLVAKLGTPVTPDRRGEARFLREFLSDPRVVDLPRWLWLPASGSSARPVLILE